MTQIVVLGSVNLDLSAAVSRLPKAGETISGATLSRFPGGKGANQALAARRLGAEVTLVASVGDDATADEALALLRDGGVDLSRIVRHPDAATGTALIAVAADGENQIVVAPGANRLLTAAQMPDASADALICQLEVPTAVIADVAARFDGFFSINLAPAKEVDVTVLQRADLVIVNEHEADWYGNSLTACNGFVATTYGAGGAVLHKGGEHVAQSPSPSIVAVDTVGAGDSFCAALSLSLVEGSDPQQALRFACAAGAVAATRKGAQPSLPTREEVEALL